MQLPTKNVPLSTQIAEQLRERIASGELAVGSRLAPEHELAASLGVSRNSVREATRSLVHSGLLVARAGDGTYVRAASELGVALERRAVKGHSDDVVEVRSLFETFAARVAAERADEDEIAAIRVALERRHAATDAVEHVAGDLAFHRAVVAASGNALLAELYGSLNAIEAHMVQVTPTATDDFAAYQERNRGLTGLHAELLNAIEAHDPARAETVAASMVAEAHTLVPVR